VVVGRMEIHVRSRLAPPALVTALTRELASLAIVTVKGQAAGDRLAAQVRLLAAAPPVPRPAVGTQP
jgi:hypothetical protein